MDIKLTVRRVINFIFDNRCIFCSSRKTLNDLHFVCGKCYNQFSHSIEERSICQTCGHPVKDSKTCPSCSKLDKIWYDSYNFLQYYRDFFKLTAMIWKKNENYLINRLFCKLLIDKKILNKDIPVTVVPDSFLKRVKKGRTSLNYLLKLLKQSGYKTYSNIYHKKNSIFNNQKSKSESERFLDISNTFWLPDKNRDKFKKEIYLIDDVYTTGSTLNYGAKLLKEAGFTKVHIVSFFRVVLE